MTSWQNWKKATTSGPKLPLRCCAARGVNMVRWFEHRWRSRPCSASARYVQIKYTEAVFPIFKYFKVTQTRNFVYFQANVDVLLHLYSWWTCSGSSAWQWALTHADRLTPHMCLYCWRSLSLQDTSVSGLLRWPFHSSRYVFVNVSIVELVYLIIVLSLRLLFFSLQNFHKQIKEMAAVMETVWWLRAHQSACPI